MWTSREAMVSSIDPVNEVCLVLEHISSWDGVVPVRVIVSRPPPACATSFLTSSYNFGFYCFPQILSKNNITSAVFPVQSFIRDVFRSASIDCSHCSLSPFSKGTPDPSAFVRSFTLTQLNLKRPCALHTSARLQLTSRHMIAMLCYLLHHQAFCSRSTHKYNPTAS